MKEMQNDMSAHFINCFEKLLWTAERWQPIFSVIRLFKHNFKTQTILIFNNIGKPEK